MNWQAILMRNYFVLAIFGLALASCGGPPKPIGSPSISVTDAISLSFKSDLYKKSLIYR